MYTRMSTHALFSTLLTDTHMRTINVNSNVEKDKNKIMTTMTKEKKKHYTDLT